MSKKRRQYNPEFKSKIAIAAARGDKTIAELAAQYEVHPAQLNTWNRELLENASTLFVNHVWSTDITYLPVLKGHFYLVAVMDWFSRKVSS